MLIECIKIKTLIKILRSAAEWNFKVRKMLSTWCWRYFIILFFFSPHFITAETCLWMSNWFQYAFVMGREYVLISSEHGMTFFSLSSLQSLWMEHGFGMTKYGRKHLNGNKSSRITFVTAIHQIKNMEWELGMMHIKMTSSLKCNGIFQALNLKTCSSTIFKCKQHQWQNLERIFRFLAELKYFMFNWNFTLCVANLSQMNFRFLENSKPKPVSQL